MAINVHTTHFRWGNDDGTTEANYTFAAAQDANIGPVAEGTTLLLRVGMQETGGTAASNHDFQLQRAINGGAFANVTTTSTHAAAVVAASFANGANATQRLTGMTGTFESSAAGCSEDGLAGGAACDIAASGNTECVFSVQFVAADLSPGDVVTFRITSPDSTVTNDVVPTATIADPQLVTPGTASLTLSPQAPTVTASDNKVLVTGVLALVLSAFAPIVTIGGDASVTPGTATLSLSTFAPSVSVSDNKLVVPGALGLTTVTFAPSVLTPATVTPGTAALVTSGFAPTVTASDHKTATPGTASLALTGYAPTATITTPPPAPYRVRVSGAWYTASAHSEPYSASVENKPFTADS